MRGDKCLMKSRTTLSSLAVGFFLSSLGLKINPSVPLPSTPPHASTPSVVHPDDNYLLLTVCYRGERSPLAATYVHYRWREQGECAKVCVNVRG